MNHGPVAFSLILLASGCIDITVNNQGATTDAGASTVCSPSGGSRADDAAASDGHAFEPPKVTDTIVMRGNLDQTAAVQTWDPTSPKTSSSFTTSLTVFDSLSKAIQLDLYFVKSDRAQSVPGDSGDWTYHVMTDGANLAFEGDGLTPPTPGMPTEIAEGTMRFDTAGRLISNILTSQGFYPKDAMGPQRLTFDFGSGTDTGGNGLDGLTQYAASSSVTFVVSGSPAVGLP